MRLKRLRLVNAILAGVVSQPKAPGEDTPAPDEPVDEPA